MPQSGLADVQILCALQDEFRALLSVTTGLAGQGWQERKNSNGWQILEAQFLSDSDNGSPVLVIASFCAFMGKEQASAALAHLWREVPARCLAMSGNNEVLETKGGNHATLKSRKSEHGAAEVESWLQA